MISNHPPGSDEAIDLGCVCPVLDNSHGIGYLGVPGTWVVSMGCPYHYKDVVNEDTRRSLDGEPVPTLPADTETT